MKKETEKQKEKRLNKLFKTISKLLRENKAGIFAIPNPTTGVTQLIIMDEKDLQNFNDQVSKNIESKAMEKVLTEEGDVISNEKTDETKDIPGVPSVQ